MKQRRPFISIMMWLMVWVVSCTVMTEDIQTNQLFQFQERVKTRRCGFENPTGAKGKSGKCNKGTKETANCKFTTAEFFITNDIEKVGIIDRRWMTGDYAGSGCGQYSPNKLI